LNNKLKSINKEEAGVQIEVLTDHLNKDSGRNHKKKENLLRITDL
jgi:hypothetical protein